jgi:hypothetical protein
MMPDGPPIAAPHILVHLAAEILIGVGEIVASIDGPPLVPLFLLLRHVAEHPVQHVKAGGLAGAVANHVVMHIGGVNAVIG